MHNGHATDQERVATFERERFHLLSVAFRILGSQPDAEDVVQETWIRFCRADTGDVHNVSGWLTTVSTRLCVDVLRRTREVPHETTELLEDGSDKPEETALLADELTSAFVVVLDELTPPQRVALVLHDAFGVPFEEIAHILTTTPGSAKKLASRARGRVRRRAGTPVEDLAKTRAVVEAFLHAAQGGNTDRLVALLDPNVVRLADAQALPPGGSQRIQGVEAVAAEIRGLQSNALRAHAALIDDRPGIVCFDGEAIQTAIVMRTEGDRIVQYDVIADSYRIALLNVKDYPAAIGEMLR